MHKCECQSLTACKATHVGKYACSVGTDLYKRHHFQSEAKDFFFTDDIPLQYIGVKIREINQETTIVHSN